MLQPVLQNGKTAVRIWDTAFSRVQVAVWDGNLAFLSNSKASRGEFSPAVNHKHSVPQRLGMSFLSDAKESVT